MDAPLSITKAYSREAQWHSQILKANLDLKNMYVRNIPYTLLDKITLCIAPKWDLISGMAIQLSQQLTQKPVESPQTWIRCITEAASYIKVKNLLDVCKKAGICQNIESILIDGSNPQKIEQLNALERQRKKANNPKSKNFMRDVCNETLKELAKKIQEYDNWKKLADGLGLSNYDFYNSPTAYSMLQIWIKNEAYATVPRLQFEAEQLNMRAVSYFLDAIPLEGSAEVSLMDFTPNQHLDCVVTKFHINLINSLARTIKTSGASKLCWKSYINKHYQAEFNYCLPGCQNPSDPLWQIGELRLETLLENFKKSPETKVLEGKIRQTIAKGNFEITSSGGVSLNQIQYLIDAAWKNEPEDLKVPFGAFNSMFVLNQMRDDPYRKIAEQLFKETKDINRWNGVMSFPRFLVLFWQFHDSPSFDLLALKHKLMEVMYANSTIINNPSLIKELEKRFQDLQPMRVYDPELAVENLSKLNKNTAEKIEEVAKPALQELSDDQLCIICIERERKYALIPCGHFAFCLECIAEINQCSVCSSTIQGKLEIFKP